MKNIVVVQITALILFSSALGGLFLFTDVYENVQATIVESLCFGCIKMDPITHLDYTFETADGQPHPQFILENLSTGPIFLAFREDVCGACDIMEPILQEIFNVHFEKEDLVFETVDYDGTPIHFVHISLDHSSGDIRNSFYIYDKDHRGGVPMFALISLGDNNGEIEPYYTTAYGTLGLTSYDGRRATLRRMITMGIDYYNENHEGYEYP